MKHLVSILHQENLHLLMSQTCLVYKYTFHLCLQVNFAPFYTNRLQIFLMFSYTTEQLVLIFYIFCIFLLYCNWLCFICKCAKVILYRFMFLCYFIQPTSVLQKSLSVVNLEQGIFITISLYIGCKNCVVMSFFSLVSTRLERFCDYLWQLYVFLY